MKIECEICEVRGRIGMGLELWQGRVDPGDLGDRCSYRMPVMDWLAFSGHQWDLQRYYLDSEWKRDVL
jgi:hypothetical protein